MKNNLTYDLYRGNAKSLEEMRPGISISTLKLWAWRCGFSLLFSMTAFTLLMSFIDDEILVWIFGLFSDNKNFINEGSAIFLPIYQLALIFFLIILVGINLQCIRIRQLNRHLLEQEKLIKDMLNRFEG